jgi:hypothetical protein
MSASLKAATSGGKRRELDFYPTPPLATIALLPHIKTFPHEVWEPACGDGAISAILEDAGFFVISQDLVDRGYIGTKTGDFLEREFNSARAIVTNPPFNLAHEFIAHAHKLNVEHIAMLLKADFWNAKCRQELWDTRPPSEILGLTWRLDFTGAGRPHRNCIWCIWRPGSPQHTEYKLLARPE